jgi:competence protein ComEA
VDAPSPGPQVLVIDVSGEVRRAGVYRLPTGARVLDAVRKARAGRRADLDALNLAARLTDGEQIGPAPGPVRHRPPVPAVRLRRHRSRSTLRRSSSSRPSTDRPRTRAAIIDYRTQHGGFRPSPSSTR